MAVSKVAYDGHTLIDLTQDTAVESDVADGKYFHKSNGERVQGTSGKVIVQGSDSSAYLIRPTAGTLAPLDCDRKSVLKKLGNTVCVNQQLSNGDFHNGITGWYIYRGSGSVSAGVLTVTIGATPENCSVNTSASGYWIAGRKYLYMVDVKQDEAGQISINTNGGSTTIDNSKAATTVVGSWVTLFLTFEANAYSSQQFNVWGAQTKAADDKWYMRNARAIDLTLWFGSNDLIPSDLLSHPENWGRYYAGSLDYNAGTLESADGSILTSLPRNFINPATNENNKILIWANGNLYAESKSVTTDFYPVIPNTTYATNYYAHVFAYDRDKNYIGNWDADINAWVTSAGTFVKTLTISGCAFVRFVFRSGANGGEDMTTKTLVASLYYPGESGYDESYPYSVLAEVDTGSEVLRSAGAVADEKTPDGTITRRVGVVDLGTIDYFYESSYSRMSHLIGAEENIKIPDGSDIPNARIIPFKVVSSATGWAGRGGSENLFCIDSTGYLRFYTTQYSDAATFKTAMSGVYLYYELATPTTEQGTAFTGLQKVDGHGTEMVTGGTTGIPVPFAAQYLKTINAAPTDTIVITENGSHDVAMYAGAIVDVSGGGTPSLQSKTVNLDSNAPSTVYPGTGYNGLSSVAFNTTGINASNIKSGTSVCGVNGTCTATFDHNVTLSIKYDNDTGKTMYVYYMDKDSSDITKVVWKSQTVAADGAAHSITFPVSAYPVAGGAIRPIIYVQGWDGAAYSDIATKTGLEWCGVVHDDSASTGSEYFVFGVKANSVTLVIENNT